MTGKNEHVFKCTKCNSDFHVSNEISLEGKGCPLCKSPLVPKPKVDYDFITFGTYQCLDCSYKKKLQGKRTDYSDVKVCPECNKGAFVNLFKIEPYLQTDDVKETSLLEIKLKDINSTPVVYLNGEEVKLKMRISLDWATDVDYTVPTYIKIEHGVYGSVNTKTVQFNQPLELPEGYSPIVR
jgi:DNA-directed RNA polymerase subunit RPC12/RpoP